MSLEKEIVLLQTELKQLEYQIKTTYEKIIELKKGKGEYVDELQQQITLARKLIDSLKEQNEKTVKLINEKMGNIPDVFGNVIVFSPKLCILLHKLFHLQEEFLF